MRYLVLFFALFASSANASTSGNCLDMARNYLIALDQAQPEMIIDSKREQLVAFCKADGEFIQTFSQHMAKGEPVQAIHNHHAADHLERSFYRM